MPIKPILFYLTTSIFVGGCSGDGGGSDDSSGNSNTTIQLFSTELNTILATWVPPTDLVQGNELEDIVPSANNIVIDGDAMDCSYETRNITQFVSELPAWSTSFASLLPGVIIGSKDLAEGVVSTLPTGDRDVPLFISASIPDPSLLVENANSSSLKAAINELQQRLVDSNVPIPATFSLKIEVLSSSSEFQHKYGVTAGIASKTNDISLDFGQDSTGSGGASQKYLIVKLVQPAYTISVGHDQYTNAAAIFGDVTEDLFVEYNSDRWMDELYPPLFVSDVTYGRMVIYVVQVDESKSNDEVTSNFGVSVGDTATEGSLSLGNNSAFSEALTQNRVNVLVLGGNEQDAFDALRTGDFTNFFNSQDPRTYVPLSYIARHVTGNREVVAIRSTLNYTVADCLICSQSLLTEEYSITTPRYSTGGSDASFSGCNKILNVQYINTNCSRPGEIVRRDRFSFIENRLGQCNASWVTNNTGDCSLNISGQDKRGSFGGVCEVACQLSIVADRTLPNQPPLCQF